MDAFERLLAELKIEHESSSDALEISTARVDEWCSKLGLNLAEFYDAAGLTLAMLFASGRESYEYCDDVANGMWGLLVVRADIEPWPSRFYEVYDAFDAGESSPSDGSDPIETKTRPAIQRILERYAGPAAFSTAKNSAP